MLFSVSKAFSLKEKKITEFPSENLISRDKEKGGRKSHRIIAVDEDLLRSSRSTLLLKRSQRESCPGSCQLLNISVDGDAPTFLGSLYQC